MKNLCIKKSLMLVILILTATQLQASELTTPNKFVSGKAAVAAEVNDNFTAVESAVNDNNSRISNNTRDIGDHEMRIKSMETPAAWIELNPPAGNAVGFQRAQYRKQGDMVCLRGMAYHMVAGTLLGELPVGYRPPNLVAFVSMHHPTKDNAMIYISPDGIITNASSRIDIPATLSGICFSVTP